MIDWPGQAGVGPEEDRTAREVSALSSSAKRGGLVASCRESSQHGVCLGEPSSL